MTHIYEDIINNNFKINTGIIIGHTFLKLL